MPAYRQVIARDFPHQNWLWHWPTLGTPGWLRGAILAKPASAGKAVPYVNELEPATSLVIAFFDDPAAAHGSLAEIQKKSLGAITVLDAALISLSDDTRLLEMEREGREASEGWAGGPGILCEIFPESVLEIPPMGQNADVALGHFHDLGFASNLLKEIGENLPPSGVALLMVVEERWLSSMGTYATSTALERFTLDPGLGAELVARHRATEPSGS